MSPLKQTILSFFGVFILILAIIVGWSSWYTIPEGYAGITKTWGAVSTVEPKTPGLHFKIPVITSVEEIETRMRKFTLQMPVSTTGKVGNSQSGAVELQMPSTVIISGNWSMPLDKIISTYKDFGSLKQYEERILQPNFLKTTKTVMAKYSIEELISQREKITIEIDTLLRSELPNILLSNINIEDIAFSDTIRKDIEKKQQAKLQKEAEEYTLQQQQLIAQRDVNIANAKKDADMAIADGNAYKIRTEAQAEAESISLKGRAEAEAIQAKAKALNDNPLIVELTKAQNWNGALPTTVLGSNIPMLMQMPSK